ncbi:hypothetical protein NDU88_002851, partial [Pleurodeles waltl]
TERGEAAINKGQQSQLLEDKTQAPLHLCEAPQHLPTTSAKTCLKLCCKDQGAFCLQDNFTI